MKNQKSLFKAVVWVALVTVFILSIPLVAMQFTDEVKWSLPDFVVMGILIFSIGFSYVLLTRSSPNFIHRAAVGLAAGSTFLLVWVNLAVGLIGSGPNAGNLMYAGIVGIVIIGTYLFRFSIKGLERVMFTAAGTFMLFAGIQLLAKMHQYPGSSVKEIILVNGFFATLFTISGLLFRYLAQKDFASHSNKPVQQ